MTSEPGVSRIAASVVMPLFNKEGQAARSVRSVLNQSRPEFELIIVNDGSSDGSREIVTSIDDRRIRVIDQQNSGVSSARNRGIGAARSELIAFCDADDEWEPDHLATILGLAARFPEARVFGTGYRIECSGGFCRANILRGLPEGFAAGYLEDYFRVASRSEPPLHTSSVAATRQALQAVGLFPVGIRSGEDLLTWARLAQRYRIAYQRRPSTIFRAPRCAADRPGRVPAEPDAVGEQLTGMLARARGPDAEGLSAYLALWFRMRGVVYLRLGMSRFARAEFGKSLRRGGWSPKAGALWLLSLVPNSGKIFPCGQRLRERLRGFRR